MCCRSVDSTVHVEMRLAQVFRGWTTLDVLAPRTHFDTVSTRYNGALTRGGQMARGWRASDEKKAGTAGSQEGRTEKRIDRTNQEGEREGGRDKKNEEERTP